MPALLGRDGAGVELGERQPADDVDAVVVVVVRLCQKVRTRRIVQHRQVLQPRKALHKRVHKPLQVLDLVAVQRQRPQLGQSWEP